MLSLQYYSQEILWLEEYQNIDLEKIAKLRQILKDIENFGIKE